MSAWRCANLPRSDIVDEWIVQIATVGRSDADVPLWRETNIVNLVDRLCVEEQTHERRKIFYLKNIRKWYVESIRSLKELLELEEKTNILHNFSFTCIIWPGIIRNRYAHFRIPKKHSMTAKFKKIYICLNELIVVVNRDIWQCGCNFDCSHEKQIAHIGG